jgi:hypothetical protein
MKPVMALLVIALPLLAGCTKTTWYREGATTTELLDTMSVCRNNAQVATVEIQPMISGEARLILPDREFNGEVFDQCMRARGYARVTGY